MALTPRRRRLSIIDLMTLVAVSALGMMLPRWLALDSVPRLKSGEDGLEWIWTGPPSLFVAALAPALLALRLVKPRPRLRRLLRQPGFVAVIVSLAVMPLGLGIFRFVVWFQRDTSVGYSLYSHWFNTIGPIPPAVAGAWLALGLSGRWKAERSWVDLGGRALGCYWVASIVAIVLRPAIRAVFPGF